MDWLTATAIVTICAGVTISIVVLVAVGSIRRSLNEGAVRQSQHVRRLSEKVATLSMSLDSAQARIDALTQANRRLAEQLAALGERVAEDDAAGRTGDRARLLH